MELGLDFDDGDFFVKSSNSDNSQPTSYNAKYCPAYWFENTDSADKDVKRQLFKFRGDNFYHKTLYDKAAECYCKAIELVAPNNKCMRRDLQESVARCYVKLERFADAAELGQILIEEASSPDQTQQSLLLLSNVQEMSGDWICMEKTVITLLEQHPYSAKLWLSLGRCYQHMYSENKELYHQVLTCFIRARLLMRGTQRYIGQFVKDRQEQEIKKVNKEIENLCPDEQLLERATKVLGEDIFYQEEDSEHSSQEKPYPHTNDFATKWFSWTKNSSAS